MTRYTIDTDLLATDTGGWSNLGDWSLEIDFPNACRALAERVGRAACIAPGARVLDLGCGAGASLALWRDHFGASHVDAIEAQPTQAARARTMTSGRVYAGHVADVLPTLADYDAIVSVDAAYHFGPLAPLVQTLAAHLTRGGALAFTTLALPAPRPVSALARVALAAASIHPRALVALPALPQLLGAAGFSDIALTLLDDEVLAGFAAFVARRRDELSVRARLTPGWLKIAATARACRSLIASGGAHYVLVRATQSATRAHTSARSRRDNI